MTEKHTHVDTFIDTTFPGDETDTGRLYAATVLNTMRFGAMLQQVCKTFNPTRLFCTYEGKRYKVVGASRLGDVWLTDDFTSTQYTKRVDIGKCSSWSDNEGKPSWEEENTTWPQLELLQRILKNDPEATVTVSAKELLELRFHSRIYEEHRSLHNRMHVLVEANEELSIVLVSAGTNKLQIEEEAKLVAADSECEQDANAVKVLCY